jgi:7,8-dihydropterin-6-yl-methyl-4-(beta-D-ribofuranosyl)aminobenzene 5'-phosphate synthase
MTDLLVDHISITRLRDALTNAGWMPAHIREIKEFDQASLLEGLDWLEEVADQDDVVFVYVASHGRYLRDVMVWDEFFPEQWAQIPSHRRLLVIDSCQAGNYIDVVKDDPEPYLAIGAVAGDEYGWCGLEEEGLPIIGGVFTYYFAAALSDPEADSDENGYISAQEAAQLAEAQQRTYMHEVVFAVPQFVQDYHDIGVYPDEDPDFPDVVLSEEAGEPLYLNLEAYPEAEMVTLASDGPVTFTIVYDNYTHNPDLDSNWGFACLIETTERTILFDTGGDSPTLLGNMDKLGIDPTAIEAVVLSHTHGDHTGGLEGLLAAGANPTIFVPSRFPAAFKDGLRTLTDKVVEVSGKTEILPGYYSTGGLTAQGLVEQALGVQTPTGLVVVTGCSHPGPTNMVRYAKEAAGANEVAWVVGGFHLGNASSSRIRSIISDFHTERVRYVSATHCTGDTARQMFAEDYGPYYIEAGAGLVINSDDLVEP